MRSDGVVPVSVEVVTLEVDTLHLLVGDPPARGVFSTVQPTEDLQAPRRGRPGDQVDDRRVVAQRLAPPIGRDEREEAMFDLVPLAGARREMTHRQRPSRLISKLLQLPFPQSQARAVAAPRIRGDEDRPSPAVQTPAFGPPPPLNGRDSKGPGVMIRPDVHIP